MGQGVGRRAAEPARGRRVAGLVSEPLARRFAALLKQSGQIGNPAVLAAESVGRARRAVILIAPAAVVSTLFVSIWFVILAALPLLFLILPELRLRDSVAQRREGVEKELPFFSVVVNVLAGAGIPLYSILRDIGSTDTFAAMRRESQLVNRDVTIFGMNPNDSLERLASNHPSRRFGDFLLGYTSKARSGGDVAMYLTGESASLLKGLEDDWGRYAARVGVIGSMMITAFGVVPLLLMVVGVFSPGFSIVGLLFFTGVGVPFVTVGLLYLAGRMQPMGEESVHGRAVRSALISVPGLLVGVPLGEIWVSAGSALFIFFVAYGLSVREQIAETRALEEGLTRFLKDLLEYKRQEYDLTRAMLAIQANGRYNPRFGKLLSRVAAQVKAGVPLDEVKVECRGRLVRLAFLLLGQMSRSGGGTVDTVFQISSFADRMTDMKRNAAAEMKPYLVLSYMSPILLAFGVTFVGGVLSSFSGPLRPVSASLHAGGIQIGSPPPQLTQVSDLLIVVSAASLGLIGAKITDFTVRNTLKASVNVALAVAAVSLMATLGSHSLTQLLGR